MATAKHGLRTLRTATSHDNAASRKVLTKAGFIPLGPVTPADLGPLGTEPGRTGCPFVSSSLRALPIKVYARRSR